MINGEHHAGATHRFAPLALVLALLDTTRIDDDFAPTGFAVQRRFHRGFEAGLADAYVRIAQIHRTALAADGVFFDRFVQIALGRLLHVADRVRVNDIERIGAHVGGVGHDAA